MKTKLQIIQQLLDDRKITAEEAMTLMQSEKEYVYIPTNYYPHQGLQYPFYPYPNWGTFSEASTGGSLTISAN